jgi:hypothetical protein
MGLTGYSSATPNTVLLDAGVLYIGTAIIGVSRGGFKFDPGKELREFEYDGRGTAAVGDHRVTKYEAVISGKLLEVTAANLLKIDAGATAATVSSVTTTTPIDAKVSMTAGGYVSDLALYIEKGDGTYRAYKFPHALCRKYSLTTADNNEGEYDVEFVAVAASGGAVLDAPYTIIDTNALPA